MNTSTIIAFAALGLIWGSNFIFMKWAAELISPIQVVFLRVLFGFLPFSGMRSIGQSSLALTGLILGLGLSGTGIAYVLYCYIVQRMEAVQASSVTYLPPVVALLIGWLLVGEPLRTTDLLAMAAILGGVYALQVSRPDRPDRSSAPQPPASGQTTASARSITLRA